MFKSFGEFRDVPCPEKNCCLPYCQFSHDPNCVQNDFYTLIEREVQRQLREDAAENVNQNNNFSKIREIRTKSSILEKSILEKSILENSMNDSAIASELEISMDEEAVRREHAKWMAKLQAKKDQNARKRSSSPDAEQGAPQKILKENEKPRHAKHSPQKVRKPSLKPIVPTVNPAADEIDAQLELVIDENVEPPVPEEELRKPSSEKNRKKNAAKKATELKKKAKKRQSGNFSKSKRSISPIRGPMIDTIEKPKPKPPVLRKVPEVEDLFGTKNKVRISHSNVVVPENKTKISIESPIKVTTKKSRTVQANYQPKSPKKVAKERKPVQQKPVVNQDNPAPVDVVVPVRSKKQMPMKNPTSRQNNKFSVSRIPGCPVPQNTRDALGWKFYKALRKTVHKDSSSVAVRMARKLELETVNIAKREFERRFNLVPEKRRTDKKVISECEKSSMYLYQQSADLKIIQIDHAKPNDHRFIP